MDQMETMETTETTEPTEPTETKSCQICCETYNKLSRKRLVCHACDKENCRSCAKRFILNSMQDAACMHCGLLWSHEVLVESTTKAFVHGEYARHRENVLFDREISLLPQTMVFAKIQHRIKEVADERQDWRNILADWRRKHRIYASRNPNDVISVRRVTRTTIEEEERASQELVALASQYNDIKLRIRRADVVMRCLKARSAMGSADVAQGGVFVRGCPSAGCRGFLGVDWKCGLCNCNACNRCHQVLDASIDHVCDEDEIKTAKMIMNDTKSCPKCATPIFKIDGCDQIWCTQCHVAFSWRTGQVETGRIHNPHYFEYMRGRNNGVVARELGDVPCGGLPTHNEALYFINANYAQNVCLNMRNKVNILAVLTVSTNVLGNMIPMYVHAGRLDIDANRDLRESYLNGELEKEGFKKALQRREKTRFKHNELAHVLNAYVHAITYVFQNFFVTKDFLANIVAELNEVINFIDNALRKIGSRYNCSAISIGEIVKKEFDFISEL